VPAFLIAFRAETASETNSARRSAAVAADRMASTMKACGVTPRRFATAAARFFTSSGSFSEVVAMALPVQRWCHHGSTSQIMSSNAAVQPQIRAQREFVGWNCLLAGTR
jgi:hypothetical protein